MFGRVSKLPSSCSTCQKRLTDPFRLWQSPSVVFSTSRECQSQDAAAIKTNDDEPPQKTTVSSSHSESNPTVNLANQKHKESKRSRRWRPYTAEGLGVNVLGRPAEVLILPTRDRRLQRNTTKEEDVDTEDVKAEFKEGRIHDHLNSELKPISATEVLDNINSIKAELQKDGSNFTADEWKDRRHRLADGFTKSQLQEYLRVTTGQEQNDAAEMSSRTGNQKRKVAGLIMAKAWGWNIVDSTDKMDPEPVSRKSIEIMASKLDFLMRDQKQPLKQISERFNVQVDVFKQKRKVEFSGSADVVDNATVHLKSLLKELQTSTLPITHEFARIVGKDTEVESLLPELMQKHNLLIRKDKQLLRMVGYASTNTDAVLRDLIIMSDKSHTTAEFTTWTGKLQEQPLKAPAYPRGMPQWLREKHRWYRHIYPTLPTAVDESYTEQDNQTFSKWTKNSLKADKLDQRRLSFFKAGSDLVRHEYKAELGQVNFTDDEKDQEAGAKLSSKSTPILSLFSPYRALLPQIMSRKEFRIVESSSEQNENGTRPFLLLLRLRPVTRHTHHPAFEMILRGGDPSLGLRQQLEIKKVVAIVDQWQHDLLLPHQPVDIRIIRRSELDVLRGVTSTSSQGCLQVLKQLGMYLERAQTSDNDDFTAIWNLDVTPLLKDQSTPRIKNEKTSTSIVEGDDTATQLNEAEDASEKSSTYILDPPEYLDVATYTSNSILGNRYLELISCDAGRLEKPAQRQLLRVVDTPLSHLLNNDEEDKNQGKPPITRNSDLSKSKASFEESVNRAYNFATFLSNSVKSVGS